MNAGKGSTAGREPTWHRPAWPLGATLRGLSPHSPLLSSDDPRLRVRAPAPGLPWTHPAHRPPSHPAERSEGAEGQEVVEHRQGPGAQSQGGSGHAAQLPQSPPQGQLGEVQPAGHMSPPAQPASEPRVRGPQGAPPRPEQRRPAHPPAASPPLCGVRSLGRAPRPSPTLTQSGVAACGRHTHFPVSPPAPLPKTGGNWGQRVRPNSWHLSGGGGSEGGRGPGSGQSPGGQMQTLLAAPTLLGRTDSRRAAVTTAPSPVPSGLRALVPHLIN